MLDITAALNETGSVSTALSPRMGRSDEGAVLFVENTAILWGDPAFGASESISTRSSTRDLAWNESSR